MLDLKKQIYSKHKETDFAELWLMVRKKFLSLGKIFKDSH